jgi:D-serine deaminase-like pyridoxal phosphate-dependent protein
MDTRSLSRRHFLLTAGAGAATVWVPKKVKGYTASELQAPAEADIVEVGVSKWELDTPALCLDLDTFDRNLRTMQAALARTGIASRPHAKTHKCPAIGRLQIATGSVGICTAKISEAEVMFDHGIEQIMMTTSNVTPNKIRRAMNLRRWCKGFIQSTDNPQNARDLSDAAVEAGVVADVIIDVDPEIHRTGVPPGDAALALAQLVDQLPGLTLRGMQAYDGSSQHVAGFEARRARTMAKMEGAAETFDMLGRTGLNREIFSGGGTGTYNIDHETAGFTDVQCGSYIFMDAQYLAIGSADNDEVYADFAPSLTVVTTVLNANFEGRATADAGAKALSINEPDPIVVGETGISYRARSDEFGVIRYDNPSRTYRVGDKLEVIIPHCDPAVNLYDHLYGIRNDQVEVIWPIYARGKSQ